MFTHKGYEVKNELSLNPNFSVSLVMQWLTLYASTAGHMGLIPGCGAKTANARRHGQKKIPNVPLSISAIL